VILLLRYLQERIESECSNKCALKVIEEIKLRLEELSIEDIEKELFR